jgi:hypothetical protein
MHYYNLPAEARCNHNIFCVKSVCIAIRLLAFHIDIYIVDR